MLTPQPIQLGNKVITFSQFIIDNVLRDAQFGVSYDTLKLALEIKEAFEKPDVEEVTLSAEALQLLKQVVRNPSVGYDPKIALQLMPFMRAVVE